MNTAIINSDSYEKHDTGNGHPEQPKRVIAIKEKLKKRRDLIWEKPSSVPDDVLAMTHTKEYINFCTQTAHKINFCTQNAVLQLAGLKHSNLQHRKRFWCSAA